MAFMVKTAAATTTLTVFNLSSRIVREITDDLYLQGNNTIEWIPSDLGAGCFLLRLNAASSNVTRNRVLARKSSLS